MQQSAPFNGVELKPNLTINTSMPFLVNSIMPLHSPHSASSARGAVKRRNNYKMSDTPKFGSTEQVRTIWNGDRTKQILLTLQSRLDKGFFPVNEQWTCYRRNYFQNTSAFTFEAQVVDEFTSIGQSATLELMDTEENHCLEMADGQVLPIAYYSIGLDAKLMSSGESVGLIQKTSKRDKGPQSIPAPKPCKSGGSVGAASTKNLSGSAILQAAIDQRQSRLVSFDRLQFRTATASIGKRRANGPTYFTIETMLYANICTPNGGMEQHLVASCRSEQLFVRGRSPAHYNDDHPYGPTSSDILKPSPIMPPSTMQSSFLLGPQSADSYLMNFQQPLPVPAFDFNSTGTFKLPIQPRPLSAALPQQPFILPASFPSQLPAVLTTGSFVSDSTTLLTPMSGNSLGGSTTLSDALIPSFEMPNTAAIEMSHEASQLPTIKVDEQFAHLGMEEDMFIGHFGDSTESY